MSAAPDEERDLLAAEHALGVLEGAERERAERLEASDPDFASNVAQWQERLAPLLGEVAPVEPGAELWTRINDALDQGGRPGNVHRIERRLTLWRTYSAAVSAVAAALLLVIAFDPFSPRPATEQSRRPAPTPPLLLANVVAEDRSIAVVVSYDAARGSLLVSPAVAPPAPDRDRQLWLIPASGTPLSLGLIASGAPHRLLVPAAILPQLRADATVAISLEPVGGSPTGQPTGPVVASGKLAAI